MRLSPHFTLAELTVSNTAARKGISNEPPPAILSNLEHTAQMLEIVREILGAPLYINSGYRSPQINALVGGAKTSAHMSGYAIDFNCRDFGDPYTICVELSGHKDVLHYDQIIHEYRSWTHISFDPRRRMQDLSIFDAKQGYLLGIQR